MTQQTDPLPISAPPKARRAGGAYRPADPGTRDAQRTALLVMEVSSLAGAAPNPATALRLIGVLFRAARPVLRTRRRESW